jgi:hypothetical protein
MGINPDRHVPSWPEIREEGITPAGYGKEKANQPCFCTSIGNIDIFLLHSMVTDIQMAREIFEGLTPEILKIVQFGPHDRSASFQIGGRLRHFWLEYRFGTIVPEERDHPPLLTSLTRYSGELLLPLHNS